MILTNLMEFKKDVKEMMKEDFENETGLKVPEGY